MIIDQIGVMLDDWTWHGTDYRTLQDCVKVNILPYQEVSNNVRQVVLNLQCTCKYSSYFQSYFSEESRNRVKSELIVSFAVQEKVRVRPAKLRSFGNDRYISQYPINSIGLQNQHNLPQNA